MPKQKPSLSLLIALLLFLSVPFAGHTALAAANDISTSQGQTVYVPVYSNVFSGPRKLPFPLAAMLSIRNTDMAASFQIIAIDYYDTNGKLVRHHLDKPFLLPPLASTYIYLEEKDTSGGFGANFIVRWKAKRAINTPIIECVMIGATSGQGISFISPGQEIRDSR